MVAQRTYCFRSKVRLWLTGNDAIVHRIALLFGDACLFGHGHNTAAPRLSRVQHSLKGRVPGSYESAPVATSYVAGRPRETTESRHAATVPSTSSRLGRDYANCVGWVQGNRIDEALIVDRHRDADWITLNQIAAARTFSAGDGTARGAWVEDTVDTVRHLDVANYLASFDAGVEH